MLFIVYISLCLAAVSAEKTTFRNVTVRGFFDDLPTFEITLNSNDLNDALRSHRFEKIVIKDQEIPTLYENSLTGNVFLKWLYLEGDAIEELRPGAITKNSSTFALSLKKNKIEKVKHGVFSDTSLTDLDLSENKISAIDKKAFENMQFLHKIKLSHNQLAKWDQSWFSNTPSLMRISADHNAIQYLPEGMLKYKSPSETYVATMILSHNKLKGANQGAFANVKGLVLLWLDHNELKEVPSFGVPISFLRVDANELTCLPNMEKVYEIHLKDNPWDCDCVKNMSVAFRARNTDGFFAGSKCVEWETME